MEDRKDEEQYSENWKKNHGSDAVVDDGGRYICRNEVGCEGSRKHIYCRKKLEIGTICKKREIKLLSQHQRVGSTV